MDIYFNSMRFNIPNEKYTQWCRSITSLNIISIIICFYEQSVFYLQLRDQSFILQIHADRWATSRKPACFHTHTHYNHKTHITIIILFYTNTYTQFTVDWSAVGFLISPKNGHSQMKWFALTSFYGHESIVGSSLSYTSEAHLNASLRVLIHWKGVIAD